MFNETYYPYLMVMKRPGDKYPTEYPCVSMNDLEATYNIFVDSDEYEVQFYDAEHEIIPEWMQ